MAFSTFRASSSSLASLTVLGLGFLGLSSVAAACSSASTTAPRSAAVDASCAGASCGPTCSDGVSDGDETGVDCGGSCPACSTGSVCRLDADCKSGSCVSGNCVAAPCGGTSCADGEACASGICKPGCSIGGAFVDAGAKNPTNPCEACVPSSTGAGWTAAYDGTVCGAEAVCRGAICTPGCEIGGALFAPMAQNPSNACQVCAPAASLHAWSSNTDGVSCGQGEICESGACVASCAATVCPDGLSCNAGKCSFGTGTAGALDVTTNQQIDTVAGVVLSASGSSVELEGSGPFKVGDELFIHQTQTLTGSAGHYDIVRVTAVSGTSLQVAPRLTGSYASSSASGSAAHAQAIRIPEYSSVHVASGVTLTAPPWNGATGGILVLDAQLDVAVDGTVSMDGAGFRGGASPYACGTHCTTGMSGESAEAQGTTASTAPNGAGGGGGPGGQDCGGGGGGAYGGNGSNGTSNTHGTCSAPGFGGGGTLDGTSSLASAVLFGGAGGEGGWDEDGGQAGSGGNGGGVVFVRARTLSVKGTLSSNGLAGSNGTNQICGGGCGMGGGGGGAGGAIRIAVEDSATLAGAQVTATGGGGGSCSCGPSSEGIGSVGRVGVHAKTVTGNSTPAFDPN